MPGAVPGATVMVPSEFKVNPEANGNDVNVTADGKNGAPFKVSFAKTVATVAPVVPFTVFGASFTASIVVSITFVVAVSQTVGLAT